MKFEKRDFKLIFSIIVVVLMAILFLQNTESVSFHIFWMPSIRMPLVLMLLAALLIGFVLGMVLPSALRWRR